MSKTQTIEVQGVAIKISHVDDKDYISLTDMVVNNGGNDKIQNWIRNKNTVEFLGAWETLNNPNFNSVEFHRIMYDAGLDRFTISIKQWVERTQAIGIISKTGKQGGTSAHKDIAFKFGSHLSPVFELLLIREFQRLKEEESSRLNNPWDIRRFVAKANYKIQTDAIKVHLVPLSKLPLDKQGIIYAEEAEIVNVALFGISSKEWKQNNPSLALNGNMRDYADSHQLIVISNMESINAEMIKQGIKKNERFEYLQKMALQQLKSLSTSTAANELKLDSPNKKLPEKKNDLTFDDRLTIMLNTPPPHKDKK